MGEYDANSGFAGFLDDFVLRTFLPQLEEKVTSVFHQAVGGEYDCLSRSRPMADSCVGNDAFQEDPNYKKFSPVPIVKVCPVLELPTPSLTG